MNEILEYDYEDETMFSRNTYTRMYSQELLLVLGRVSKMAVLSTAAGYRVEPKDDGSGPTPAILPPPLEPLDKGGERLLQF